MNSKHNDVVSDVLLLILEKIGNRNLNWVLVGSTNLFIQGIEVNAKDIDIVSTKEDILKIESILKEYSIKKVVFSESDKYRSWFGRLIINNIHVDLMAELEYKPSDGGWMKSTSLEDKELITFNESEIPVTSIENELAFYKKMKRKNDDLKIKLIEQFVNKQK